MCMRLWHVACSIYNSNPGRSKGSRFLSPSTLPLPLTPTPGSRLSISRSFVLVSSRRPTQRLARRHSRKLSRQETSLRPTATRCTLTLAPQPSTLNPQPSTLTPHLSLLTSHLSPLTLTPHPSPLTLSSHLSPSGRLEGLRRLQPLPHRPFRLERQGGTCLKRQGGAYLKKGRGEPQPPLPLCPPAPLAPCRAGARMRTRAHACGYAHAHAVPTRGAESGRLTKRARARLRGRG